MERNNILHLRNANGIKGLCIISMQTAVERQLDLGHENLDKENYYMLVNSVCPPVIAVLAGAILNCIPSVGGEYGCQDWSKQVLWDGIKLLFDDLSSTGKKEVQDAIIEHH